MIQILGSICIVFATSYLGFTYGTNLHRRIRELSVIKKIVTELYSDVEYGACSLKESFERIEKKQEPMFARLLKKICSEMEKGNGLSFADIFEGAVSSELNESALQKTDKEQLISFASQLGNHQRNSQLRIIQLYLQELEQKIEELEQGKQEKQKVSRILGISSGILIVILLL